MTEVKVDIQPNPLYEELKKKTWEPAWIQPNTHHTFWMTDCHKIDLETKSSILYRPLHIDHDKNDFKFYININ